jgi:hypothetical protein
LKLDDSENLAPELQEQCKENLAKVKKKFKVIIVQYVDIGPGMEILIIQDRKRRIHSLEVQQLMFKSL